jgi:hypothetical protein
LINGNPIYSRSAVNVSIDSSEPQEYKVDDGRIISHNSTDGAVVLAKRLLDGIIEVKSNG